MFVRNPSNTGQSFRAKFAKLLGTVAEGNWNDMACFLVDWNELACCKGG